MRGFQRLTVSVVVSLLVLSLAGLASAAIPTQQTVSFSANTGAPTVDKIIPPPPGFDPRNATDAQLHRFGFPSRPFDPKALIEWTWLMSRAKEYVPSHGTYDPHVFHTMEYSTVWAGYDSVGVNNGNILYNETSARWTQPTVNSLTGSPTPNTSFWTGIGGDGGAGSSVIVQAGCDSIASNPVQYKCWVEDYPQGTNWQAAPVINGGDQIYVDVQYWASSTTFSTYLSDVTTGKFTSVQYSAPYYDGKTADFINEQLGSALPSFSPVTFTNCTEYWSANGTTQSQVLGNTNYITQIMTTDGTANGTVKSSPGAVSSGTGQFTVTWNHQ